MKTNQKKLKRIYHPYWDWECYHAGFFNTAPPVGMDADRALNGYMDFLSDVSKFRDAMEQVAERWPKSCEHFLTNTSMNRVAWLGQAAMCITTGVPSTFRAGFKMLTPIKQEAANQAAQEFLANWEDKCLQSAA